MQSFDTVETASPPDSKGRRSGCRLQRAAVCLLVMLALAIAAGVGYTVYITTVQCTTSTADNEASRAPDTGSKAVTANPNSQGTALRVCRGWVLQGGRTASGICDACPSAETQTTVKTVTTLKTSVEAATRGPVTESTPAGRTSPTPEEINYSLPNTVVPSHYSLRLQPEIYDKDPSKHYFQGSVTIDVTCRHSTDVIVLHAQGLSIPENKVNVLSQAGNSVAILSIYYEEETAFVKVRLAESLQENQTYQLQFRGFTGKLSHSSQGLHATSYTDGNNTVYGVGTRNSLTSARRVFPCFDEPALRATFDLVMTRMTNADRKYVTLFSTGRDRSQATADGWTEDVFQRTPKMATYSLAFAVCDYPKVSSQVNGVTLNTWVRPSLIGQANHFHKIAVKMFEYIDSRFRPSYNDSMDKLDFVLSPDVKETLHGAWGLVQLADNNVYSPSIGLALGREYEWIMIAQRIIYTWLNHIVSPAQWDDKQLTDALINYYCMQATEYVRSQPEIVMMVIWINEALLEAESTVNPLVEEVTRPERLDIPTLYPPSLMHDTLVARMMHLAMGDVNFVNAINQYIESHKYGSAENKDLWSAFDSVALAQDQPVNVSSKFKTWLTRRGYPVVMVTVLDYGKVFLTQKRLSSNSGQSYLGQIPPSDRWDIPITFTSSQNPDFSQNPAAVHWLGKSEQLELPNPVSDDPVGWVIVNRQNTGFYRVNYNPSNWEALIHQLNKDHTIIHPQNRAQILQDSLALAEADSLDMSLALRTLSYLSKEEAFIPLEAFDNQLETWEHRLDMTEAFGSLQAFVLQTVNATLIRKGLDIPVDLSVEETAAWFTLMDIGCRYGFEPCVEKAKQQVEQWRTTGHNNINPNVRDVFYCIAVREGGPVEWRFILSRYQDDGTNIEMTNLLRALACSREPYLIHRLLAMTLAEEGLGINDLFEELNRNRWANHLAFPFIVKNLARLSDVYGSDAVGDQVLGQIVKRFNTEFHFDQLDQLEEADVTTAYTDAIQKARQTTKANITWMKKFYNKLTKWLQ